MSAASPPGNTHLQRIWLAGLPAAFVLLWATGFIGARMGTPHAEPFTFLLLRFILAAALLLAAAVLAGAAWPSRRGVLGSLGAGALLHGVYLGGVFWAIAEGLPAGIAALIVALQPILTALLAGPMLGERVAPAHWLGLVVGLAGLTLVIAPGLEWSGMGTTPATVGAVIVSVIGIVLGSIGQKRYVVDADLRTGTFLQYVGGGLVVALVALLTEDFRVEWTGEFVFALGWLVLVLSIGAVSLYMVLISHGALARTATLFYLVPPVTALIAWFLFDETLSATQLVGMAVAAAGVAVATRLSPRT